MLGYTITSLLLLHLPQRDDGKKHNFKFQHWLRLLRRGHDKKYKKLIPALRLLHRDHDKKI